jgi:hypothetical protein
MNMMMMMMIYVYPSTMCSLSSCYPGVPIVTVLRIRFQLSFHMVVVPCVGVLGSVYCRDKEGVGGVEVEGLLWPVGLYVGVEDCIREYGLRVI